MLARRYEWDMDALWQDLLGWLDKQPRSVRHRPQLSENIQMLMQEAWLITSLNGEEQIRSVHLLMALAGKQNLVRCDGLWPLLTLARGQLERMRPLLDAQSDERQEVQREAELAQRQRQGGEVEFVGRPVGAEMKEGELSPALQNALEKFTLDVTASAREGKIDPVFGRDTEIRQMVDILSRRRKNNPILVGEPDKLQADRSGRRTVAADESPGKSGYFPVCAKNADRAASEAANHALLDSDYGSVGWLPCILHFIKTVTV